MLVVVGPICTVKGTRCIQVMRIATLGFSKELKGDTYYAANWPIDFTDESRGMMIIPKDAWVSIVDSNGDAIEEIPVHTLAERYSDHPK